MQPKQFHYIALILSTFSSIAIADDDPANELEHIRISSDGQFKSGTHVSASQGWVSGETLVERPMLRTGEMLEFIPGMMVTQHSGSGKANQYFLRGFNLDHGTDFAVTVDGMPVNMRSHGHGQGYSDLNFIIPELVDSLSYFKGTYYANIGDFSGAGGAYFDLKNSLDSDQASITLGQDNYHRMVTLNQVSFDKGTGLLALEYQGYDGPWTDINEDIQKKNAIARIVVPVSDGQLSISAMAYDNSWNSADQIPQRAVDMGLIDNLGSIDTQVGGESSRYSLSAQYQSENVNASFYAIDSALSLFSNFTYFLENPDQGDQFEQQDERNVYGADISTTLPIGGLTDASITLGAQWRYDDIGNVGLYPTTNRQRTSIVREDAIDSSSYAAYAQAYMYLTEDVSLTFGGRYDYMDVQVKGLLAANSGDESDSLFSLKAALKWSISDTITAFANWGQGFHSNDARGATIKIDPVSGDAVEPAPLLVRSTGYEAGLNWTDNRNFNVSAALWQLDLDSELVYVGDAGFTEASRPSDRHGIEVSAYYWFNHHVTADIEAAWTKARFSDNLPDEGNHIDGTVPVVVSAGASWYAQSNQDGLSLTLRARYLSSRTVDSNDSISPPSTFLINTQMAYTGENWKFVLEMLNSLNNDAHDIDYFYASRLPGEPDGGIEDLHYHPVEPRTLRASFTINY